MTVPAFRLFRSGERVVAPGSATGHARPSRRAEDLLGPARTEDPPTDPFGFPPVGAVPGAPVWPQEGGGAAQVVARPAPADAPGSRLPAHPAEAAALAAAFAADYLSWDEDDPDRRARVLGDYLAHRRPVRLGWSGRGRQRADFALPGLVRPDGDGGLLVDVRVRVTPYRAVPGGRTATPDDDTPAAPSAAPAPAARGWRGLPGQWVRISVAVAVVGDRLVVDAEEEAEDPWAGEPPELDIALDGDTAEEDT